MSKIIVIGAGMIGSAMALDVTSNHKVVVADINEKSLQKIQQKNNAIQTIQLNVQDKNVLATTIAPFDIVLCAVPGFMGFETLKTIIKAGKNVVDISFFPENALALHDLAQQHQVTAIVDCGVAPGMGNIILGYYNSKIKIERFECLVGGLPKIKKWPFNYKAPFSPIDVIEEYTRPARYVENGKIIIKPAMSDVEHVEIPEVGTLETFNTDGLRSLIYTLPHIPNMKEKTMRYPGHIEKITALRDAGFFNKEAININGTNIIPLDFTSNILFKEWKLEENEEEMTVMRITIESNKEKIIYHLKDEFNKATGTSSMARTTGYTATAAMQLLLDNLFIEKGVFPPELIGKHETCFNYIMHYLQQRNIHYKKEQFNL